MVEGVLSELFVQNFIKAVIALFIIIDPLGNIPIFLGLTSKMSPKERRKTFNTATAVAFALLAIFALMGQQILEIFGISIYSFMIAGGLLLLMLAIKILVYGEWEERALSPDSVGAVPIAFPLLAGPGAITTAIMLLQTTGLAVTALAILTNFSATWLVLHYINPIHKFLGKTGSAVVARVMSVLIAAIAIQFIIEGLSFYLKSG